MVAVNAQYNVAAPESLAIRVAGYQRRRMFQAFLEATAIAPGDSVLDVGVTSDRTYDHSNYFEAWYPYKDRITAAGLDDASFLEQRFPGVRFVFADGRNLPFEDGAFDYIHSSAVLEHVGCHEQQGQFLRQAWRVARKGIFVTTPNRWFPIEFHTVLPLLHWLPPPLFRAMLQRLGKEFFASEQNLNLLSASDLLALARTAGIHDGHIRSVSLFLWPTNLLLLARRR